MRTTSLVLSVILSVLLSLFLVGCGGGDPTEGEPGAAGAPGKNALMNVSAEPAGGGHCAVSGSKIDAGLDINANGLLDANEVSSTQYLCSGTAGGGANALVQMLDEASGANCAAGGKAIHVGLDANANGVLEPSEITNIGYVCNGSAGANGANGTNGTNGSNGISSLIRIASEPAGANCTYAGNQITSGPDTNANGALDASEVSTTNYSCNGAPSADLNWVIVDDADSPKQVLRNTNYLANGDAQVVLTLPADADISIGEIVRINGAGAGGWKIAQNAGQAVYTKNLGGMGGRNWTGHDPSGTGWMSVASSADGNKLVAVAIGQIYTSSDSGASWASSSGSNAAPVANWYSVASSADGSKLVAVQYGGKIYTSSNGGGDWAPSSAPPANWVSVASSAGGSKLVAVQYGGKVYTSSNGGADWAASSGSNPAPSGNWISVASSADGGKVVVVSATGPIYTSSDSGASWAPSSGPNAAPAPNWLSVASSADGSKLVAGAQGGTIYTSSDSGASWAPSSGPNAAPTATWYSVASSADGSKLVAVASGGQIYTSSDSGVNWAPTSGPQAAPTGNWTSVASSADGSKLVAGAVFDRIYTSTATTTVGTTGSISGGPSDAIELQYVGNGMFTVLSHSGSLTIQ